MRIYYLWSQRKNSVVNCGVKGFLLIHNLRYLTTREKIGGGGGKMLNRSWSFGDRWNHSLRRSDTHKVIKSRCDTKIMCLGRSKNAKIRLEGADTPQHIVARTVVDEGHKSSVFTMQLGGFSSSSDIAMLSLIILQGIALAGAVVTGILARQRRQQLEVTNGKLRKITAELWKKQREAIDAEEKNAVESSTDVQRMALESILQNPSAAHPMEEYGNLSLSLARARRLIDAVIEEGKTMLASGYSSRDARSILKRIEDSYQTATEIKDLAMRRTLLRLKARLHCKLHEWTDARDTLEEVLQLSDGSVEINSDSSWDADTLGALGDVYTEMGDLETAGRYYDRCFDAIRDTNTE